MDVHPFLLSLSLIQPKAKECHQEQLITMHSLPHAPVALLLVFVGHSSSSFVIRSAFHIRKCHQNTNTNDCHTTLSSSSSSDINDLAARSPNDAWEEHYLYAFNLGDGSVEEEKRYHSPTHSYVSQLVREMSDNELEIFIAENQLEQSTSIEEQTQQTKSIRRRLPDPLWAQIRLEAQHALFHEPDAGPQLYQNVLRQPSLIDALASIICHEIETELIPATALKTLILDQLNLEDDINLHLDVIASANRNPSSGRTALTAVLFHQGLHALVCYRVAHRLWQADRTGMAMYVQSTVSSKYAADIHPACEIKGGVYLSVGGGVVIGETARVGNDVTILQGVTLGGTGKEAGDRHPKVGDGVILHCGATVLGNLQVGRGAVITAKSIVTKPVPDLARVSGVPATVKSFRELAEEGFVDYEDEEDCGIDDLNCRVRKMFGSYFQRSS